MSALRFGRGAVVILALAVVTSSSSFTRVHSVAASGSEPIVVAGDELSACTAKSGGKLLPSSREEFIYHFVGTWLLCNSPSVFGGDEEGLEISLEGRWWKLTRTETGELARLEGWDREGS
jgi:hypothetical protein